MTNRQILIQLPAAQHAALKAMADHVGLSLAAQARIAFQYYLDAHAPKVKPINPNDVGMGKYHEYVATMPAEFPNLTALSKWQTHILQLRSDYRLLASDTPIPEGKVHGVARIPDVSHETPESIDKDLAALNFDE